MLIHEQGVHSTTLAQVAKRADVPVGNVYYYFKTKDDLVSAVLDAYAQEAGRLIESFGRHRSPQARLKALVRKLGPAARRGGALRLPDGQPLHRARQDR